MPRPVIVGVGPLPPPWHGASIVTGAVRRMLGERLGAAVTIAFVDTGPGAARQLYHVSRAWRHVRALAALVRFRGRPAKLVYVGGAGGFGLWYQYALVRAAAVLRYDTVFHHHSYNYLTNHSTVMRLIDRQMRRRRGCRHIFLTEQMAADFVSTYGDAGERSIVSNATFIELGPERPAVRSGEIRLLHLSNLSVAKGSVDAIACFMRLRQGGRAVTLTVAGPVGDAATAGAIDAASTAYPEAFAAIGPLERHEVPATMAAHDIMLFPSRYQNEAQPLVVLEALACGTPVVGRPVGSVESMLPADWLADSAGELDEVVMRVAARLGQAREQALVIFDGSKVTSADAFCSIFTEALAGTVAER